MHQWVRRADERHFNYASNEAREEDMFLKKKWGKQGKQYHVFRREQQLSPLSAEERREDRDIRVMQITEVSVWHTAPKLHFNSERITLAWCL